MSAVVIIGAFTGLLWSSLRSGTEYFKNVDEVLPEKAAWQGKTLQLHGYVVPGSMMRKPDSLEWRFKVQNDPPRGATAVSTDIVEASYTGVVPDTFKDEAEVVLHGQLTPSGFQSDNIVAKCPSKYEAKDKFDKAGS